MHCIDVMQTRPVRCAAYGAPMLKPIVRLAPSLLAIWGIALGCLSLLDWVGYGSFWLSFAFR